MEVDATDVAIAVTSSRPISWRHNLAPTAETIHESLPQKPPVLPHCVAELRTLSSVLYTFDRCFQDLQNHIHSINTSIDSLLPPEITTSPKIATSPPSQSQHIPETTPQPPPSQPNQELPESFPPDDPSPEYSSDGDDKPPSNLPPRSELESFCLTMGSRGLRKYLISQLSNPGKIREEVPKALKLAESPARLVLECVGKFYVQGRNAFPQGSHAASAREASVIVMECFLLMVRGADSPVEIDKAIREEAQQGALVWKKRLVNEGGVLEANEIDARGLLFLIGCFGIPSGFRNEDVRDLLRASNVKEVANAVRGSKALMVKILEIIDGMVKNKMEVDAVDLVYSFALEDKFNPQKILISFLRESKESWKQTKKESHGSLADTNKANKKVLADLKSVVNCLESHKVDPVKLLSGLQIYQRVSSLEKEINDLDRKLKESMQKRKADEIESSKNLNAKEIKRARFATHVPQQPRGIGHVGSQRIVLDAGVPSHVDTYGYSASSPILRDRGVDASVVSGISVGARGVLAADPYNHRGMLVDSTVHAISHGSQLYGRREDAASYERLVPRGYAGQTSSIDAYSLYRPSASLESTLPLGIASTVRGAPGRSSASDLYKFADAVGERESHRPSAVRSTGAVPAVLPAHHPSYLY